MSTSYGLETAKNKAKTKISVDTIALLKENADLKKENAKLKKQLEEASDNGKGTDSKNSSRGAGASKTK